MIGEQIKNEIALQVSEQFKDIKKSLEIFSLPMQSQYRILTWNGLANGLLAPVFDINSIIGRYIVIKGFQIVSYYQVAGEDISLTDGVTINTETIGANIRVQRCLDTYTPVALNYNFQIIINGNVLSLFQINAPTGCLPPDFQVDNIYYKHPAKVSTMQVLYVNEILTLMVAPFTTQVPLVKVFVECYLI